MKPIKRLRNYLKRNKADIIYIEKHLESIVMDTLYKPIEEFNKNEDKIYLLFNMYPNNIYGHIGMAAYSMLLGAYPAAISHIKEAMEKDRANEDAISIKCEILYSSLITNPNIITFSLIIDHKNPVDYVNESIKEALKRYPDNKIINNVNNEFQIQFRNQRKMLLFKKDDN